MLNFQRARAYDIMQVPQDAGLTQWGINLVNVLMNGPAQLTDSLARQIGSELLGGEVKPTFVTAEVTVFPSVYHICCYIMKLRRIIFLRQARSFNGYTPFKPQQAHPITETCCGALMEWKCGGSQKAGKFRAKRYLHLRFKAHKADTQTEQDNAAWSLKSDSWNVTVRSPSNCVMATLLC